MSAYLFWIIVFSAIVVDRSKSKAVCGSGWDVYFVSYYF